MFAIRFLNSPSAIGYDSIIKKILVTMSFGSQQSGSSRKKIVHPSMLNYHVHMMCLITFKD